MEKADVQYYIDQIDEHMVIGGLEHFKAAEAIDWMLWKNRSIMTNEALELYMERSF